MADADIGIIPADTMIDARLSDSDLLEMYRQMTLVRTLDERIWMLNRQGKAAIVASSQGHEAGQIGSMSALEKGKDQFYIYYRDLAVMLMLGMTPVEIMSGFLAKEGEPLSGARQFPTHGAYPRHRTGQHIQRRWNPHPPRPWGPLWPTRCAATTASS